MPTKSSIHRPGSLINFSGRWSNHTTPFAGERFFLSKYRKMSTFTEEIKLRQAQKIAYDGPFYVIYEVDHIAERNNSATKDKYEEITKILFVSSDKSEATLRHKQLIKDYPDTKFKVIARGPDVFEVIDIEKKPSWTGAYRTNDHIKTVILGSWVNPPPANN